MNSVVLVIHNVRSCHNVGSLLRTADGLGIDKVYLTGYTPYPATKVDERLPNLAAKIDRQIAKTALGAEKSVDWTRDENIAKVLDRLHEKGYEIVALEQADGSISLGRLAPSPHIALIVGSEIGGLPAEVLSRVDKTVEIPMAGKKESFNVSVAGAIALYHIVRC